MAVSLHHSLSSQRARGLPNVGPSVRALPAARSSGLSSSLFMPRSLFFCPAARTNEFAAAHYQKILTALSEIGKGSIYDVADRAGMSHVQVARRTAEMDGKRIRTIPGEKRRSPSGRPCRVWTPI